jgi:arylsulfatase A-like enzyme/thioredoxin-like negative regulator of GroEL
LIEMRTLSAATILLVLLTACPARREERAAPRAAGPVILISIDTLRSDRVGHGLTPRIDELARDGVRFERAFSHVPQTFPSHTTVMTGLLPQNNGVRDNIGYTLAGGVPTLADVLRSNGYATGAAVSSYVLRRATGLDRGFDFYDDAVEGHGAVDVEAERNGDRTREALEQWLAGTSSRKLFAFLHLYEPHAPYRPPEELGRGRSPYDGEVAYADAIVGRFLATLKKRGLYDDALIVLFSDHGEGLGDHGEDEHGVFVYREALQVPLIVKLPGRVRAGTSVASLAALTDIAPTVLAAAGVAAPHLDGVDLFGPPTAAGRQLYAESYYGRFHLHWAELTSLIDGRFQYIEAPARELYDHAADPAERTNLAATDRRTAFALAAALKPLVRLQQPSAVDDEDRRKLAALGYIGSSADAGGEYPDPKTRIQYLRMYQEARRVAGSGAFDRAVPLLQTLTRENPALVDEWLLLADAYEKTGRRRDAIATLTAARPLFHGSANVTLTLARMLVAERRYDEAREAAAAAVGEDPALAYEMLSRIALLRGDVAGARRAIGQAEQAAPHRTATLLAVAEVATRAEDWSGALAALDRAAAEVRERHLPPLRDLEARRGDALLHLMRGPEAEQAFRAETTAFPDNLPAWGNLAVILAAQGRRDDAVALLREVQQKNPGPAAERMVQETMAAIR